MEISYSAVISEAFCPFGEHSVAGYCIELYVMSVFHFQTEPDSSFHKVNMSSRALRKAQRERDLPAAQASHDDESGKEEKEEEEAGKEQEELRPAPKFVQKSAFALLGEVDDNDSYEEEDRTNNNLKDNNRYLCPWQCYPMKASFPFILKSNSFQVKMTTISATLKRSKSNRLRSSWLREGRRRKRARRVPCAIKCQ